MMKFCTPKIFLFLCTLGLISLSGCEDKWDSHYSNENDGSGANNLYELISSKAELSKFAEFLKRTGYDSLLMKPTAYSVWAPSNDALAALPDSISGNSDLLKQWMGNYICISQYFTNDIHTALKVKNLVGKNITFSKSGENYYYDLAKVTTLNLSARNGALFIIDKIVPHRLNIWEYLHDKTLSADYSNLAKYLKSLDSWVFDQPNAIKIGEKDGQSIYDSVSATRYRFIYTNAYLKSVTNVNSEDNEFTFFALTNSALNDAFDRLVPYYRDGVGVSYTHGDSVNIYNALLYYMALDDKLGIDEMPSDSVTTEEDDRILSPKAYLVGGPANLSNGYLYKSTKFTPSNEDMVRAKVIEAESSRQYFYWDSKDKKIKTSASTPAGYRYVRQLRELEASGRYDIYLKAPMDTCTNFGVIYNVPDVNSIKYKFIWRASPEENTYQALEVFNDVTNKWDPITSTPVLTNSSGTPVHILGEYTFTKFGAKQIRVRVAKKANLLTNPVYGNTLRLDYIKMVPVFN